MWQPIETAPKDRAILVFDGRGMYVADRVQFTDYMDRWECWPTVDDYEGSVLAPTHWMPLPPPPGFFPQPDTNYTVTVEPPPSDHQKNGVPAKGG